MQYKIPVQVENEDPIIFGLSLRQIIIIVIAFAIASVIFKSLAPNFWTEIALFPSWLIAILWVLIAIVKIHHMSFFPLILSISRNFVNPNERFWVKWVDSTQPIDVWYVFAEDKKKEEEFEKVKNHERLANLKGNLDKL